MDGLRNKIFPVAMRLGDTPVLIPNTMVKTLAADDTTLETMWESRWLPESFQKLHLQRCSDTLDLPVIQDQENFLVLND